MLHYEHGLHAILDEESAKDFDRRETTSGDHLRKSFLMASVAGALRGGKTRGRERVWRKPHSC